MLKVLRTLAERHCRWKVIRRRMPARFGGRPVFLSPDSALTFLKRNWTHGMQDLLVAAEKFVAPGDNVWDIGANLGVFSLAAAHKSGAATDVVLVEADPFLASLLQRTATDPGNADRNLQVVCAAASHQEGMARFLIASRGRASNSLEDAGHRSQAGGTRYVQNVPTLTLDKLLSHFAPPQLVKIDVEGAEGLVLQGASRLLAQVRPTFYIEVGSEQNQAVTATFKHHGYRLFDGDLEDSAELDECAYNTLAVPSESPLTNRGHTAT